MPAFAARAALDEQVGGLRLCDGHEQEQVALVDVHAAVAAIAAARAAGSMTAITTITAWAAVSAVGVSRRVASARSSRAVAAASSVAAVAAITPIGLHADKPEPSCAQISLELRGTTSVWVRGAVDKNTSFLQALGGRVPG